jgi:TonB family protein
MYTPYRDEVKITFQINWDNNTFRGFIIALCVTVVLLLMLSWLKVETPQYRLLNEEGFVNIPFENLNFGNGDGTGQSKGNLSAEGVAHKGQAPSQELEDAQRQGKTHQSNIIDNTDELTFDVRPVSSLKSTSSSSSSSGSDARNVGTSNGFDNGTGLGEKGFGTGAGEGFGDIEWGGGGNRRLLNKVIPKLPQGLKYAGTIRLALYVAPDGSVSRVLPIEKSDPRLESACIEALRKWKFNPIPGNVIMKGIITFKLNLK